MMAIDPRTRGLQVLLVLIAAMLAAPVATAQAVVQGDDRIQVYVGAMLLDDQSGELQNESGEPVDIDFSDLFAVGFEVETPYRSKDTGMELGVNAGIGVSWKGSDTKFAGKVDDEGGVAVFRLDNEMLIVEAHIGPYMRAHLGKKVDFYLGAGPAAIYVEHDGDEDDDDESTPDPVFGSDGTIVLEDDSSTDLLIGFYARTGIEYDLGAGKQWGLGVRYLGGEVDFDDTVGQFDLKGLQVLLTYSAWF